MTDVKTDMTLVVAAYEHHQYRPMGAPGEVRIHGIFASQYTLPDGSVAGDFQWLADQYKVDPHTRRLDALVTMKSAQTQADVLLAEIERLRNALHRVSLASCNSGCTKEDLGNDARKALEDTMGALRNMHSDTDETVEGYALVTASAALGDK